MTTTIADHPTDRAAARAKRIVLAAIVATATASMAGLALLALDPTAGSTAEGVLGLTAAVSGLATAGLVIGAAIYAQAHGLWGRLPISGRAVLWALLAVGIARTIWSQVSHLV